MDVKSLAIAQPTFLPWSGWYDLVDQVDLLILLDDVAFSKQSWQQRNRIRTPDGLSYLTVPVQTAGKLGQRICDTKIVNNAFVRKIERTVAQNYRRAEYLTAIIRNFVRYSKDRPRPKISASSTADSSSGWPPVWGSPLRQCGRASWAWVESAAPTSRCCAKNSTPEGISRRRARRIISSKIARNSRSDRLPSRFMSTSIRYTGSVSSPSSHMQAPLTYFSTKASALGRSCDPAADRDALCGRAKRA